MYPYVLEEGENHNEDDGDEGDEIVDVKAHQSLGNLDNVTAETVS